MRLIALPHVGYHYMNSHLIHDQTFTGYPGSLMGCTQNHNRIYGIEKGPVSFRFVRMVQSCMILSVMILGSRSLAACEQLRLLQ